MGRSSWIAAAAFAVAAAAALFIVHGGKEREEIDLLAAPFAGERVRATGVIDLGGDDDHTRQALGGGWSYAERGWGTTFAWTDAATAGLRFFAPAPGAISEMRFRALPADSIAVMHVSLDGEAIADVALTPGWSEYTVALPAAKVRRGFNHVELSFAAAAGAPVLPRYVAFDTIGFAGAGDGVDAAPASDAAWLGPGEGVQFLVALGGDAARLRVSAACDGAAAAPPLEIWIGAPGEQPEVLARRAACHPFTIALAPQDAPRQLTVLHAGPAASPRLRLEELSVRRARAAPAERPNALLIILDAQRADHLRAYGYERETSPWLDRLAADGALFSRAFVQAPQTISSLPSILTGLYPPAHRVEPASALAPDVPTLAGRLAAAGYRTAAISANAFMSPDYGLTRGFSYLRPMWLDSAHVRGRDGAPRAEALVDAAAAWLAGGRAPFFVLLHFLQPHAPYWPPAPYLGHFGDGIDRFDGREDTLRSYAERGIEAARSLRQLAIDRYDENVLYVDAAVGRLLRQLDLLGLGDHTAVVVTADHGEGFLDHHFYGHPPDRLYDENVRVPLIMRLPDGPRGARVDAVVQSVDIGATLLDLIGLRQPFGSGRSLLPLLRGEDDGERPAFSFGRPWGAHEFTTDSVRTRELKLIRRRNRAPRLFDLGADPGELHDVAAERPADVAQLSALLDVERARLAPAATQPAPADLDPSTRERLRALGYLDE